MTSTPRTAVAVATLLLTALTVSAMPALAGCAINEAPSVPDGASAGAAEMNRAQEAVKAYIVETQEFLICLEGEAKGNFTPEMTARYNEATNRMSNLAMQLNAQLRSFKSRG
ncbi:hypothetical protein CHU95_03940 [Niveispirillum lacus]|uniref:Uncharacterized protein n=1 Tax=Niveispirillum lacus TaxID=1981099 RepID=A0A255Z4F8_9PROT|nr:hypothetical protein [Niveispirillum lacus]OYQ36397.1 hypothetical protein CHU95_03940 [Niveispirillum lacus]